MMPAFATTTSRWPNSRHTLLQTACSESPVADVRLPGDNPAVQVLDRFGGLLQILRRGERVQVGLDLLADIDGDDVGALFGEADGMAPTLAAPRPGDECNLPFQPTCHGSPKDEKRQFRGTLTQPGPTGPCGKVALAMSVTRHLNRCDRCSRGPKGDLN